LSRGLRRRLPGALHVAGYAILIWLSCVVLLVLAYRFVNPLASNLMIIRWLQGARIEQTWIPIESISPQFTRAVIASEDARFCVHFGVDFSEVAAAFKRSRQGTPRGASTISMQVVKNLFLWPGKSYVRKAIEAPLTLLVEAVWPKWRIFEIYANVAELGRGVFGAEAAARRHFGKSASRLTDYEAALLAAALPNPIARNAGRPGAGTQRLAQRVRMRMRGGEDAACVERRTRSRAPKPVSPAGPR
jgi:monofunctional biosynthetic peptidoglycan transglycosylase